VAWDASARALKARVKTLGRIGRVITAPDLGLDQLNALIAEVTKMIEDPNYAIVANYEMNWQEVNSFLKEELNNLIAAGDNLKQLIATGMGIPESLLSGESQYTGDNIKVEILNTQYFAFKVKFQNLLEDKFMKPIALRKGFVGLDEWGSIKLFHPKLTFSLLNLRSAEYFEMLMNLYQKGSLNIDIIYDLLNLDGDGIIHALKQDLWTLKNDKFNVIVEDLLHAAAEKMAQETDFAERILEGLGLNKLSSVQRAEQELAQEAAGGEAGGMGGGGSAPMGDMGGGMDELGGAPAPEAPEPPAGEGGGEAPSEAPKIDIPVPAGQ
jgi:CO dehydrogenase/acetyl-CoA synthase epsilon subunit